MKYVITRTSTNVYYPNHHFYCGCARKPINGAYVVETTYEERYKTFTEVRKIKYWEIEIEDLHKFVEENNIDIVFGTKSKCLKTETKYRIEIYDDYRE